MAAQSWRKYLPEDPAILYCPSCQFAFYNPMIDQKTLEAYYQNSYQDTLEYFNQYGSVSSKAYKFLSLILNKVFRGNSYIKWIVNSKTILPQSTKILELGPGRGHFLKTLKQKFDLKNTYAVEMNKHFIKTLEENNIKVIGRDIENVSGEFDDFFNVIMSFQLIEHLNDPIKFLKRIKKMLKVDGLLYLDTPNSPFTNPKWTDVPETIRRDQFDNGQHILFFSLNSFKQLAEKAGLEVVQAESIKVRRTLLFDDTNIFSFQPHKFKDWPNLFKTLCKITELTIRCLLGQDIYGKFPESQWSEEGNNLRIICRKRTD